MKAKIYTLIFSCLLILLGTGCSTAKKISSKTTEISSSNEKRTETHTWDVYTLTDTTKKSNLEITYTKTEFYPPEKSEETTKTEEPKVGVKHSPDNIGAIKSIEQLTLKATEEQNGISENRESDTLDLDEEIKINTNIKTDTTEKPAADPYRWRYIFGIIISIIIACFFLRKNKIFISIISFFKRVFF